MSSMKSVIDRATKSKTRSPKTDADKLKAAMRKYEKLIAQVASGAVDSRGEELRLFKPTDPMYNLVRMSWAAHDDAARRDAEYAQIETLRGKMAAAIESGRDARIAANYAEISSLRSADRDRIAIMSPSERAHHRYQEELKILRGSR